MSKNIPPEKEKPLKALIEASGNTQKSFAEKIGLAYSTVKSYVALQKTPGADILADMCRLLERSPKEVMKSLAIDVSGIPDDIPKTVFEDEAKNGAAVFADMCRLLQRSPKEVMKNLGIDVSGIPDDIKPSNKN